MPQNKLDTLSARVQFARALRGMSCRGLSVQAGVSQALVGQIERNEAADPHGSTIVAIAKTLQVDVAWLLTGAGDAPRLDEPRSRRRTGTSD